MGGGGATGASWKARANRRAVGHILAVAAGWSLRRPRRGFLPGWLGTQRSRLATMGGLAPSRRSQAGHPTL